MARIKRDREFARLFYAGAVEMLLEGDSAGALSRLRDLVNAEISFKELARQTGLGEKSLHRMLNRNGNPTARNLGVIVKSIAEDLGIKPRVEFAEEPPSSSKPPLSRISLRASRICWWTERAGRSKNESGAGGAGCGKK